MLNQVMLAGRIVNLEINEKKQEMYLTLSVSKNHKNSDGIYESVLVPCLVDGPLVNTTKEYCNKDDIIGVRGSLEVRDDKLYALAERITMLKSKSEQ